MTKNRNRRELERGLLGRLVPDARRRLHDRLRSDVDARAVYDRAAEALRALEGRREPAEYEVDLVEQWLREDGVIAVNITNHQLDLAPVLAGVARRYGLGSTRRFTKANAERMLFRADWVLLSRNQRFLAENPPVLPADANTTRRPLLWTDDYSNLFQLLK